MCHVKELMGPDVATESVGVLSEGMSLQDHAGVRGQRSPVNFKLVCWCAIIQAAKGRHRTQCCIFLSFLNSSWQILSSAFWPKCLAQLPPVKYVLVLLSCIA